MRMTRKICFRLAGDTGVAVMAAEMEKQPQRYPLHRLLAIKQRQAFQPLGSKKLELAGSY
jgi:hypothetical protein